MTIFPADDSDVLQQFSSFLVSYGHIATFYLKDNSHHIGVCWKIPTIRAILYSRKS